MRKHKSPAIPVARPPQTADGRPVVELAGFRRRLAAMLYESLLLAGVLALAFLVPYLAIGVLWSWVPPGWLAWLHVFVVLGVYFVFYWSRHGQSLAMQTWRLQIVTAKDGRPLHWPRALLRYCLSWPSLFSILGVLWALIDRDRQYLHDRLCGTCIVLLPAPPKKPKSTPQTEPQP